MFSKRAVFVFSLILSLFLVVPVVVFANSGAIDYITASNYTNPFYNSTIGWNGHSYDDSRDFAIGSDSHINFNNFSMGSYLNPSWTFGIATQHGNANISVIASSYIRFDAVRTPIW